MKELVLGAAQLGLDYGINNKTGKPSVEKAFNILDTAYEGGIRILDTAPAYGDSEKITGQYMKLYGRSFKIATKLSKLGNTSSIAESVKCSIDHSLNALNTDTIDFFFIHNFNDILESPAILAYLERYKKTGLLKYVGVSIYETGELKYILDNLSSCIDIVQIPFNILDLRWLNTDLLEKAKANNIKIFARSVFLQGLFFLDEDRLAQIHPKAYYYISLLNKYCRENSLKIQELALKFLQMQACIDFILVGCEVQEQLQEILDIYNRILPVSEEEIIDFAIDHFSHVEEKIIDPRQWVKGKD